VDEARGMFKHDNVEVRGAPWETYAPYMRLL